MCVLLFYLVFLVECEYLPNQVHRRMPNINTRNRYIGTWYIQQCANLKQIHPNMLQNHFRPYIVHTKYDTFTVYLI